MAVYTLLNTRTGDIKRFEGKLDFISEESIALTHELEDDYRKTKAEKGETNETDDTVHEQ